MGVVEDTPGRARRLWSDDFGGAFVSLYGLAFVLRIVRWLAGIDRSASAWRMLSWTVVVLLAVTAVGWAVSRVLEWRAGLHGSVVDGARPWVQPIAAIMLLAFALWVAQSVF